MTNEVPMKDKYERAERRRRNVERENVEGGESGGGIGPYCQIERTGKGSLMTLTITVGREW